MALKLHLTLGACAALSLFIPLCAAAAVAPQDIQAAIEDAHVLPAGTRMTVAVNNGPVVISTYRATTDDKDNKIDAVLMARAAMRLSPETITRVTIYFYSGADLTHYKEVTLSTGDLSGFGAGDLNKEQLLSSVNLIDHKSQDAVSLSNFIKATEASHVRRYEVSSTDSKGRVVVKTQLESWLLDSDAKYEALKLADKIIAAAPAGTIKSVHVKFTDPENAAFVREVDLKADEVHSLQQKIADALSPLSLTVQHSNAKQGQK